MNKLCFILFLLSYSYIYAYNINFIDQYNTVNYNFVVDNLSSISNFKLESKIKEYKEYMYEVKVSKESDKAIKELLGGYTTQLNESGLIIKQCEFDRSNNIIQEINYTHVYNDQGKCIKKICKRKNSNKKYFYDYNYNNSGNISKINPSILNSIFINYDIEGNIQKIYTDEIQHIYTYEKNMLSSEKYINNIIYDNSYEKKYVYGDNKITITQYSDGIGVAAVELYFEENRNLIKKIASEKSLIIGKEIYEYDNCGNPTSIKTYIIDGDNEYRLKYIAIIEYIYFKG